MIPTVSAIVVNFNGREFVGQAIESLMSQSQPVDEIIVVDNASTDGTIPYLERNFPTIVVIELEENLGFTGGCNAGFRQARGDFIALLNSDAHADVDWIRSLCGVMAANDEIASAQGKIYVSGAEPVIDQAGAVFNQLGNYWGRGHLEPDVGQFDSETEVPGLTACATLIRRIAVDGEDLFDPEIFMYGEELDLTIRLRLRNHRIVYVPDAVVHHAGKQSVRRSVEDANLFQQYHSNRNRLKILFRWYPVRTLLRHAHLLALGLVYWNVHFFRLQGARFAARAVADQIRCATRGIRQRDRELVRRSGRWMRWMENQSLQEVLRQKERMRRFDQKAP